MAAPQPVRRHRAKWGPFARARAGRRNGGKVLAIASARATTVDDKSALLVKIHHPRDAAPIPYCNRMARITASVFDETCSFS